jgi:hypothetical protein
MLLSIENTDQRGWLGTTRQRSQRLQIVVSIDDRNHQPLLAAGAQLGVGDRPRDPPVSVGERMDLRHQEHREYGAGEARPQRLAVVEAAS